MFSQSDIENIYTTKVKLPESYFKKYERSIISRTCEISRNYCIMDFKEWTKNIEIEHLACTSDDDPELKYITYKKKTVLPYPPCDLHVLSEYYTDHFDFFLFSQTLEHLYNPFDAVKQIYTAVKVGGYVFTSVPTLNIPHNTPIHFNGFTPMGLAMLFKTSGFEIVEIGQWGNYDYIEKLWKTHAWPTYNDLEKDGVVLNEERNVCQCWILARKV